MGSDSWWGRKIPAKVKKPWRAPGVMIPTGRYEGRCYACDSHKLVGVARHNGTIEPACKRHTDPTIKAYFGCMFCNGPVRAGSLAIEGDYAHHKCHDEASR